MTRFSLVVASRSLKPPYRLTLSVLSALLPGQSWHVGQGMELLKFFPELSKN